MNAGAQTNFKAMCIERLNANKYVFITTEKNPNRSFVIEEKKRIEKEERIRFNATYVSPVYDTDQQLFYLNDYKEYIVLSE